ncbi:MAG TPA: hypothetical protein VFP12_15185 [Allosphingosinicella sp.]|nr:hypothetical protein [Allosphingosinicella sp.]
MIRQIDWRSEIAAIRPYLDSQSGVIHIRFKGSDCAPNQFSTLLKQLFSGFDKRFSIRVDHDFATTHVAHDILTEFETQLGNSGIKVEAPDLPMSLKMLSDIEAGGNSEIHVGSISVNTDPHHAIFSRRAEAICSALERFIAEGGRFMVEHRDAPVHWQRMFLERIWGPILSKFADRGLVYIQMLGPESHQMPDEDAPKPQVVRTLPTGFETDEARESDAYDDLIDIFEAEGHTREAASAAATAHLQNNLSSVSKLHNNLAGVLLSMKQKQAV